MLLPHGHIPPTPPQRIVSLVPSQTELLAWLGLAQQVVGITKFCVRPREWWRTKVRVGGTKQLHLDRIRDLQPDLIIGNKEENTREQVLALAESFPVWISEVSDLPTAYDMIETVGRLTHRQRATQLLNEQIQAAFAQLPLYPPLRAAYLIWRKPYMVAGGDTFIQAMLEQAGFINVFADRPRYPVTTTHELAARAPQLILLSSEPFPFNDKHRAELAKVCPSAVIMLVDGEAFSWYGSRLLTTPGYLHNLRNSILAHVSI